MEDSTQTERGEMCVLVFFYVVLIHKSLKEHWTHLAEVFELMKQKMMYATAVRLVNVLSQSER